MKLYWKDTIPTSEDSIDSAPFKNTWAVSRRAVIHMNLDNGDGNWQALKDINANCPEEEELIIEFIDPCLTSIYQPPDVAVNGSLKKMIREEYHNHVTKLYSTSKQSVNIRPGYKISVFREDLVGFIKNTCGSIQSPENKWICQHMGVQLRAQMSLKCVLHSYWKSILRQNTFKTILLSKRHDIHFG